MLRASADAPAPAAAPPKVEPRLPSVVITHDFAETYGGAERVTQELAAIFRDALVWGVLGRPAVAERMGLQDRWRSVLPARPALLDHYRGLAPVLPAIARSAELPAADVLLSSSYGYAHHFRTANRAPQVCYCHSPLRFAWTLTDEYAQRLAMSRARRTAFRTFASYCRALDRRAVGDVSVFLTQSPYVGRQIERFYERTPRIIGAPIDCTVFRPDLHRVPGDYWLVCSRLVEPYKKVGIAVEAFRRLGRRLVIAGDGPAMEELRAEAPPNVQFSGHLEDHEVVALMQDCSAVLFPSRDDFGLIPLEAMACGKPVLAFDGGGAPFTVVAGVTGEFFDAQTPESIVEAVERFDPAAYDPARIRAHAEQWDREAFRAHVLDAVASVAGSG